MKKFFVKDSDQEVKFGNMLHIKAPISTPYGEATYEADVLITPDSLKQLLEDGLVVKKEISDPAEVRYADYRPFVKQLAKRIRVPESTAVEFLDIVKAASAHAHNTLMIDLMAEVMNRGKKFSDKAYIVNFGSGAPVITGPNEYIDMPKFTCKDDAMKTVRLIMPFVIATRNDKK